MPSANTKKIALLLLIVALAITVPWLLNKRHIGKGLEVDIAAVEYTPIESQVLATGHISYSDERQLRSQVTAEVIEVTVEEGDRVTQGQILIKLDPEQYSAELDNVEANVAVRGIEIERAKLNVASLQRQVDRQQQLYEQNLIDAGTIESLRDRLALAIVDQKAALQYLRQAEAALEKAQDQLDKTIIRSPIDGIVSKLDIKVGEMAISSSLSASTTPLMTVADTTQIYSEVEVDEADIGRIAKGQLVRVYAVAHPDTELTSEVISIATSARQTENRSGLTFKVKVLITDQEAYLARPGMSCRAEIVTQRNEEGLSIPLEAILEDSELNEFYVMQVDGDIVRHQTVTLGDTDYSRQEILSGLEQGQQVVTGPLRTLRTLKDGDLIRISDRSDLNDT